MKWRRGKPLKKEISDIPRRQLKRRLAASFSYSYSYRYKLADINIMPTSPARMECINTDIT